MSDDVKDEAIRRLEEEHGFIVMKSLSGGRFAVVSEEVAAGKEREGWERITARKQDLPLPCQGGDING